MGLRPYVLVQESCSGLQIGTWKQTDILLPPPNNLEPPSAMARTDTNKVKKSKKKTTKSVWRSDERLIMKSFVEPFRMWTCAERLDALKRKILPLLKTVNVHLTPEQWSNRKMVSAIDLCPTYHCLLT